MKTSVCSSILWRSAEIAPMDPEPVGENNNARLSKRRAGRCVAKDALNLVHGVLDGLARLELDALGGRDLDRLLGLGVAAGARGALGH